jgi:hypothetical protein
MDFAEAFATPSPLSPTNYANLTEVPNEVDSVFVLSLDIAVPQTFKQAAPDGGVQIRNIRPLP